MSTTVRDLINGSLRLIGAIATGEAAQASEATDGMSVLNELLDSWSNESLTVYGRTREEFTLTAGKASYTMGASGDFDTTRPLRIERALLQTGTGENELEIPIDLIELAEWSLISVKNTTSSIPRKLYAEGTNPLETLNLWPVPSVAEVLVLYSWKPLTTFTSLSTEITLPPGYLRALRYNLAVELAPEYGVEPSSVVAVNAVNAKQVIQRMNIRPQFLKCDGATLNRGLPFNILTGE